MTPEEIDLFIETAKKAKDNAIVPYSRFRVGAALMTAEGGIYRGCNIENPSLMLSFCAERAVIIKALSEGERHFKAMAIASDSKDYCFPCGACRQMIAEFAPDIEIYLVSEKGIKKFSIKELLPHQFKQK